MSALLSRGWAGKKSRVADALFDEFNQWATSFHSSNIDFQTGYTGYDSDRAWWSELADPFKPIANRLFGEIPNCKSVYWVDFTLKTLYP